MMTLSPYTHMATSGRVPLGEAFVTVANGPHRSLLSLTQKKIKNFIYHHTFAIVFNCGDSDLSVLTSLRDRPHTDRLCVV